MKKYIWSFGLLITCSLGAIQSGAITGAAATITLQKVEHSALSLMMGDAFILASSMASSDAYRFFLNLPGNQAALEKKKIYHGRAQYNVNTDISKLDRLFFEDINVTRRLVGTENTLSEISSRPFAFSSSVSAPMGMKIKSTQTMTVYEAQDLNKNAALKAAILNLSKSAQVPGRVIIQKSTGFNMFFNRAFLVTFLTPVGSNRTQIDVISAVLIDSMPPLVGEKSIRNSSRKNLVVYAKNLSKENR